MAKFNIKSTVDEKVINLAGGQAHAQSPELEFASLLLTSFVEDKFYESRSDTLDRVSALLDEKVAPEFAAKAAVYARDQFNMRSISHVVGAELAQRVKGSEWMRPFVKNVIVRVDDMLEILAYYEGKYGRRPVPNALKRGIRDAFDKFDGYQLAKYRGEGREISLVDVVNLVHPVPTDRNCDALSQLVAGALRSTDTWETKLTQAGQRAESNQDRAEKKAEAWAEMVLSRRIGYMALVRNLRNIIQDAPEVVGEAAEMLVQPEAVRRSRMLPFRFVTARKELAKLKKAQRNRKNSKSIWESIRDFFDPPAQVTVVKTEPVDDVLKALDRATEIAPSNVPRLEGRTLVAVDDSGSMTWSAKVMDIASLFGAVIVKANPGADLMLFSNDARFVAVNADDSLLEIQRRIAGKAVAGGTNFHSIFDQAERRYDRIVILSDMQGWMPGRYATGGAPTTAFSRYRTRTGADPHVYSFDLQGYGTLMFPERKVYGLSGFSEKVFDVMALLEQDREALVHEIEAVQLA